MIIARGAIEISVRFHFGARRRSRRTRPVNAAHRENVVAIDDGSPAWPPPIITDALIAEHVALAHALRRAAMRQLFLRVMTALGLRRR